MAVALTTLLVSPAARSQPPDTGGVSAAPTLPLAQLGAAADLAFYGIQGTEILNVPVPPGLEPVALNAITQLPVNVRSATITVMQGERTIARVDAPPGDRAPVVIPLAGAAIVDNAVSLTLRTYILPVDGYCLDPTNPLRLSDGSVTFAGVEQVPVTVADFLPPVLRQLTVFVDAQPSQAESDAAVRLVTAVAAHYGTQYPDIAVAPLAEGQAAPAEPSAPLQRHIVIREAADVGVSLLGSGGVPALLVAGPAEQLGNQSRLLTSDLDRLAIASKAVAGPLASTPQLPGDQTTLRRLGQPGVNATALSPQVGIGLDQTRLGRSAHGVRVHLRGSYTPLPESIGGQLVASIAGDTVDRWPADPSGTIDRWVDVPDDLLQRYTTLALRLDISGNTGRCGEFQPLTLTIDGDSPVLTSPAQPPVPGGFQSLPQALMPRTVVGIDGGLDDTRRAAAIMVGLQRLSALPIDTTVMPLQDAIAGGGPAVLISPGGWTEDGIDLPVAADADGELTVERADAPGETTTLRLDPVLGFGSLQVVHDGRRSMLIATSTGASEQLDALLVWLGQNPQRWSNVDGTALIGAPGRQPVVVDTTADVETGAQAETSTGRPWWVWAAVAVAASLVVLAIGFVVLRARRTRDRQ
ncbi:hypothetical protein H7I57_04195 [Mycobacterium pyrenivorans]|nr:hypothetical protein [Mycolicibacterium pyrenivorans]